MSCWVILVFIMRFSSAFFLAFVEFSVEEERCESIEQLFRAFPALPVDYHFGFVWQLRFKRVRKKQSRDWPLRPDAFDPPQ